MGIPFPDIDPYETLGVSKDCSPLEIKTYKNFVSNTIPTSYDKTTMIMTRINNKKCSPKYNLHSVY